MSNAISAIALFVIYPAYKPLECITIDIMVPLPITENGR